MEEKRNKAGLGRRWAEIHSRVTSRSEAGRRRGTVSSLCPTRAWSARSQLRQAASDESLPGSPERRIPGGAGLTSSYPQFGQGCISSDPCKCPPEDRQAGERETDLAALAWNDALTPSALPFSRRGCSSVLCEARWLRIKPVKRRRIVCWPYEPRLVDASPNATLAARESSVTREADNTGSSSRMAA